MRRYTCRWIRTPFKIDDGYHKVVILLPLTCIFMFWRWWYLLTGWYPTQECLAFFWCRSSHHLKSQQPWEYLSLTDGYKLIACTSYGSSCFKLLCLFSVWFLPHAMQGLALRCRYCRVDLSSITNLGRTDRLPSKMLGLSYFTVTCLKYHRPVKKGSIIRSKWIKHEQRFRSACIG